MGVLHVFKIGIKSRNASQISVESFSSTSVYLSA